MTASPQQLPVVAATPTDDEIDLRQLAAALQRHWRLIAKVAGGALLLSGIYAFTQPRVWEGEFQIVLASGDGGGGRLAQLAAANPMLAGLAGLSGGGSKDSLETEVKILESPSVLKPVYDFVRSSKQRAGENVDRMRFSDWVKSVDVELEKGTSVLNIAYTDTDKELVLPVIQRISKEYQIYSGRDRRRDIANAVAYLRASIAELSPKAEASMQRAQDYALSNGLGLQDGLPASSGGTEGSKGGGGGSVEANRQQAQAQVALLQQQLSAAEAAGNRVLFQAPQLEANAELYGRYQQLEAQLTQKRAVLRDNDDLIRNLERQRQSLITTLNRQTIGLLQGQLATAQAALQASSRPKEVVLKHRELVRQALRDERTLVELENQLQLAQLEQAKQTDPWELISTPTLLDAPVAPRKSRILAIGLLAGLVAGSGAALVVDRRSGRVFAIDELSALMKMAPLAHLNMDNNDAATATTTILCQYHLQEFSSLALVPLGLGRSEGRLERLLALLQAQLPNTKLHLAANLLEAEHCEQLLLITATGAPNRRDLAELRQQLDLQAKAPLGWLLLEACNA